MRRLLRARLFINTRRLPAIQRGQLHTLAFYFREHFGIFRTVPQLRRQIGLTTKQQHILGRMVLRVIGHQPHVVAPQNRRLPSQLLHLELMQHRSDGDRCTARRFFDDLFQQITGDGIAPVIELQPELFRPRQANQRRCSGSENRE